MIRVITIEREYGSGGADIARALSNKLNWRLVDQSLIEEVARIARVNPTLVESCDECIDPWYHRLGKAFWQGSIDRITVTQEGEMFDSERMVELARHVIEHAADAGNCVIVGRGAACQLSKRADAFHIFIYASPKFRLRFLKERFPERAQFAEEDMEANDRRRAAYMRTFFKQEWDARKIYHIMLNACMGERSIIEAIINAAHLHARE